MYCMGSLRRPYCLYCYVYRPAAPLYFICCMKCMYYAGPSLRPATFPSRVFSPVSLGFMGWMLGAHGVDKGFPMRKLLTQYERTSRKRTYSVTNVTSVLSRRGNEYCVTCRVAPRAFALQTAKTRILACER